MDFYSVTGRRQHTAKNPFFLDPANEVTDLKK